MPIFRDRGTPRVMSGVVARMMAALYRWLWLAAARRRRRRAAAAARRRRRRRRRRAAAAQRLQRTPMMGVSLLLGTTAAAAALAFGGNTNRRHASVVPAPPEKQQQHEQLLLFVDRANISTADPRLALQIQEPVRGPWVITPTEPWEAWTISGYNSVVAGDGTRPHRLFYTCIEALHAPPRVCLAESTDGLKWTKPLLGVFERNGSTHNNILLGAEGCSVFIDTRPAVLESARWKMVCSNGENKNVFNYASRDGVRWQGFRAVPLTFSDDTQPTAFYDYTLGKYVIYVRRNIGAHDSGHRRHIGRCLTANLSDWQSDAARQTCNGNGPLPCGCEVVFGPDESDPPNLDVYTSAHLGYPAGENPTVHLFFPSMFSHFAGTDKHTGPPNGHSNDGLIDTRLLVARDHRSNLSYAADGSRAPFLSLGINLCGAWTPSKSGGWCSPADSSLAHTPSVPMSSRCKPYCA
jgi:hypothetical protein